MASKRIDAKELARVADEEAWRLSYLADTLALLARATEGASMVQCLDGATADVSGAFQQAHLLVYSVQLNLRVALEEKPPKPPTSRKRKAPPLSVVKTEAVEDAA